MIASKRFRGALLSTRVIGGSEYLQRPGRTQQFAVSGGSVRAYCHGCGRPYPWTAAAIEAAKALAEELQELTSADRLLLQSSIDDLVSEGPRTNVAIARVKKLIPKIGKQAAEGFRDILINILSDAVRKQLWPGNS
jgi:hypothetical protein